MRTRRLIGCALFGAIFSLRATQAMAQVPVAGLVTGIIKKVIIALDLKVQQLQNQTIALQNTEVTLENNLHLSSLSDISGWLSKERSLYQQYYKELATVRTLIADYDEVSGIIRQQKELMSEYHSASLLFHGNQHFSASELQQMDMIYAAILQESIRNLNEAMMAVKSFLTQMSDAERLNLIHRASAGMQTNLDHLRQFNEQNSRLSSARAAEDLDRAQIRALYGLK